MKTLRKVLGLLSLLVFMSLVGCSAEYAKDATVEIFTPLIHWLFVVSFPVVLALVGVLLAHLKKKYGWEMGCQMKQMLDGLIIDGISYADEQAKKALGKAGKLPSDSKLKMAVDFVAAQVDDLGLPQKGGDALAKLIEAKLNTERHAMRSSEAVSGEAKLKVLMDAPMVAVGKRGEIKAAEKSKEKDPS